MFLTTAEARLNDSHTRSRIQYFADHANSFEGWLNWELAHAFQLHHPWPAFSAHREYPLEHGGLADIAVYEGRDYDKNAAIAFVETKFVWNNTNAKKQIASAYRDRERITSYGSGIVLIVAISALHEEHDDLYTESADALIKRIETGADLPKAARRCLLSIDVKPGPEWYVAPSVRVIAYPIDAPKISGEG